MVRTWLTGRSRLGKRVGFTPSRVRIPHPPPRWQGETLLRQQLTEAGSSDRSLSAQLASSRSCLHLDRIGTKQTSNPVRAWQIHRTEHEWPPIRTNPESCDHFPCHSKFYALYALRLFRSKQLTRTARRANSEPLSRLAQEMPRESGRRAPRLRVIEPAHHAGRLPRPPARSVRTWVPFAVRLNNLIRRIRADMGAMVAGSRPAGTSSDVSARRKSSARPHSCRMPSRHSPLNSGTSTHAAAVSCGLSRRLSLPGCAHLDRPRRRGKRWLHDLAGSNPAPSTNPARRLRIGARD